MIDTMLLGVLRAPHSSISKKLDGIEYGMFQQLIGRMRQAADRIEADADRIAELEHEHWLDTQEIKDLRKRVDEYAAHIDRIKRSANTAHLDEVLMDSPVSSLVHNNTRVRADTCRVLGESTLDAARSMWMPCSKRAHINMAESLFSQASRLERDANES